METMNMTNFERLSEEEKELRIFIHQLHGLQDYFFHTYNSDLDLEGNPNLLEQLEPYRFELVAMMDWLSKKLGREDLPLWLLGGQKYEHYRNKTI
jgi:hypothetical protein